MKKRLFTAILAVFMTLSGICVYAAEKIPYGASKATESVVRITINTSFGTEQITGIAIGKGFKTKYILTSLRAIEGHSGDIFVGCRDDQNIKARGVIATSQEKDIAVLELAEEIKGVKIARLKKGSVENGTEVYALGRNSRDDENQISEGVISSKNTFEIKNGSQTEVYQITAQMSDNNNGGALVNKSGDVVGVNYYDGNVNQNKAVTSTDVIKVLDEKGIPYKKATIIYLLIVCILILAAVGIGIYFLTSFLKKKKENSAAIVGISGEFSGQRIAVGRDSINIGRDAKSCQVVIINDNKVSRCHCSIRYDSIKGLFVLTDLSSTHGTRINGNKLEPKVPAYISDGMIFAVGDGNTSFKVSVGGGR